MLLALVLGAVALRGQSALEALLQQSRAGASRMLQINGHMERLGEHGVTMERAARQYLVLGDAALRATFERTAADAALQVQALAGDALQPATTAAWRAQMAAIAGQLSAAPAAAAAARDGELAQAFRELGALHSAMAEQVRGFAEARNTALQADLDAGRAALAHWVPGAMALALLLALALALWLARPLQRVEAAILGLGENRLDDRIDIRGPADVRQIGRRLDWLRQRLAALDADKARFLRHVSHELKTPLAALHEGVALLQDGVAGPLSDNQREVARILHDNTAALQRRIEDLLRFNAAAFAAQRLVRKPTDVMAVVAALIDEQQLQWRARGLRVQAAALGPAGLPATTLHADIDAGLLGSAIGNLLSNAIRFSPPRAAVQIDVQRVGTSLCIDVADQGPGVAPADRDRIFEPFFRGQPQPAGGLPGTGIGLSIVAETVAAHGGQVGLVPPRPPSATSQADAAASPGARFRIELPHAFAD